MTTFRLIPMALVISVASTLMACNKAPSMPMMQTMMKMMMDRMPAAAPAPAR